VPDVPVTEPESAATAAPTRFSFSRLKAFAHCPRQYRYRYLEGRREAFRSIETHLGRTTHAVLEWLYSERDRGDAPSAAAMHAELARRWHQDFADDIAVVRLGEAPDDSYRSAREMLERFHREVFLPDRSVTVALEQVVTLPLSPAVTFTGVADRVGRTPRGRLFVVDYKTSRSEGDCSDFSEGLQAPLYAACALDRHGDPEALAGYHYLRHGSTRWQSVSAERGQSLLGRFLGLAEQTMAAAEHPVRPSALCAWCGFNHLCPSAQVPERLSGGLAHARRCGATAPSPEPCTADAG
jgi:putative RecB family exonuclease